ncbi:tRNA threonylcarbamoyl adenosine modification protein YeaZ [Rubricella aquisinus]|uniref:tRNA threonylcarbamoyl adenosine modification protein YeaZ n=1 Tax=Rubricella aquisinus TaxID=2028108 RepID=A0A840WSM4_9RHOB|nr:tRNA (adenosine(37)-N6)-threonylcarbamoyltransferase complex dimerization subunit type 1 TsaB [Rubricella aquisinus]MBB5514210.1 tRNA threonylcarbamoyl adenosine modification protein YeaZ [Rubricella aquisinus]
MILAFDTSGPYCAAALLAGDEVRAHRHDDMARGQAEHLLPMLDEVLAAGGVAYSDLTALAVCTGPGNFTGIRISVAAARGLGMALGVPVAGVSMLEALAHNVPGEVLVTLDARRGAIYAQGFRDGVAVAAPELTDQDSLDLSPGVTVLGFAAPDGPRVTIAPTDVFARIAATRIADGAPIPRPAPLYIRPADAALPSEAPPRMLD